MLFCLSLLMVSTDTTYPVKAAMVASADLSAREVLLLKTMNDLKEEVRQLRLSVQEIKSSSSPKKKVGWRSDIIKVGYGVLLVSVPASVGYLMYKLYSGDLAALFVSQSYDGFDQQINQKIDNHRLLSKILKLFGF